MRICIVVGTRPEIIKMSPVIRECQRQSIDFFVLHTGQHYSDNLDSDFFNDLALPTPQYNLAIGSQPHRQQVGRMTQAIIQVLSHERPSLVVVQGDTNSVLAGALAASRIGIPVAHHEAGLRSHDPTMPEETNRITVDNLSDLLLAPTATAVTNLREEGLPADKIFNTGNTIVDAVHQNLELARQSSRILDRLGLRRGEYGLVTVHRAENVDKPERLAGILAGLARVSQELRLALVCPLHPRTRQRITDFGLVVPDGILCVDPLGYLDMLQAQANARIVLTDSGGLQEEACILQVPCVTLRDNTERPETIEIGANILVGADPDKIVAGTQQMLSQGRDWRNPFGDGHSARRIVDLIVEHAAHSVTSA